MLKDLNWPSEPEREKAFREALQSIDQEAKEYAAELCLSEEAGYDLLAVMHGQAFLGEREAFEMEAFPPSSEETAVSMQSSSSPIQKGEEVLTDEVIIQMIRSDSKDAWRNAWRLLFEKYREPLFGYICKHHRDRLICEEVLQDTFLHLYDYIKYTSDAFDLKAWLCADARYQILKVKSQQHQEERESDKALRTIDRGASVKESKNNVRSHTPNTALRRARHKQFLTIAEAATKIDVSTTSLARWERGDQAPHLETLNKLCELFNATPEELGFDDRNDLPMNPDD